MDTRTRTASPSADDVDVKQATPPPVQDKISAYYSLVFPHFTFYIQTLSITIGRRCAPNAASSSSIEYPQVDVDLGALKSVSRLHAKIEYDQDEDRFVLVVIGRNGAWVDGVWSGAGTRAPLAERSQIQIASRLFHFVLPPPPPPEDTPSPSSQSSVNRQRSPSVDITSISPPSSQPSHSPPPEVKFPPPSPELQAPPKQKPKAVHLQPHAILPNSNSIGKSTKSTSKKRKKGNVEAPLIAERPKPEIMPPKPPFTYAQLIYRSIKDNGGKATLQEICNWIMNKHEYYQFADAAWMSSVRHNLSSSRAFLKGDRCGGERGKGFFWSVDEKFAQALEEQEMKAQQAAAAAAQGLPPNGENKNKKKDKSTPLEPPLKRSIKGDTKGAPLPPPLTSSPLTFKTTTSTKSSTVSNVTPANPATTPNKVPGSTTSPVITSSNRATTGVFTYPSHVNPAGYSGTISCPNPYAALAQTSWGSQSHSGSATTGTPSASTTTLPSASNQAPANQPAVPDVIIPIVLGPIPLTHPDCALGHPNNSAKEGYMVLHERKLILDPDVFGELTKDMLEQLEKMGAPTALGILTGHMIRALKERRARERGKDRGTRKQKGPGKGGTARKPTVTTPFTKVPLDQTRKMVNGTGGETKSTLEGTESSTSSSDLKSVTSTVTAASPADVASVADPGSPIIDIDGDSEDEGPAAKKRKILGGFAIVSA